MIERSSVDRESIDRKTDGSRLGWTASILPPRQMARLAQRHERIVDELPPVAVMRRNVVLKWTPDLGPVD